jgi:hypothetical protein
MFKESVLLAASVAIPTLIFLSSTGDPDRVFSGKKALADIAKQVALARKPADDIETWREGHGTMDGNCPMGRSYPPASGSTISWSVFGYGEKPANTFILNGISLPLPDKWNLIRPR